MPALSELLPRLASSEPSIRNGAALDLRDLAESGTRVPVEPFLSAISDPANHDNRGTLVYALQMMDCSGCFTFLFDLALHANFECQNHALTIVEEQAMWVTPDSLRDAEQKLRAWIPSDLMTGEAMEHLRNDLEYLLSELGDKVEPDPLEPE